MLQNLKVITLLASFVYLSASVEAAPAAATGVDCIVNLPDDPLSAKGLSTPWTVTGCNQLDPAVMSFAQGAVLDEDSGEIFIYNPLLIPMGGQAGIAPTPPKLPKRAVVALWFGTNGNTLTLNGNNGIKKAKCVNGADGSIFGQFANCNAENFFKAVNNNNKVKIPKLQNALDGKACPTVRSFSVVDQDQSDNVVTTYLLANGQLSQDTAANRNTLGAAATVESNGSDNALLLKILAAIGCQPFTAKDLADNGARIGALPLNELQPAANPKANKVMALVPSNDPMVLNNGNFDMNKLNLYRLGVDQPANVQSPQGADTTAYCKNIVNIGMPRLVGLKSLLQKAPSLTPIATNLFTFLATRLSTTLSADGLNCVGLLNITNPVTLTIANGVTTDATITLTKIN